MKNKTKKEILIEIEKKGFIELDVNNLSSNELDDLKNSTQTMNLFFNYIKEYHENLDKK